MKKRRADLIGGLAAAAAGLFFLIATIRNPQMTFAASTTDGVPGGGFFPYILSVLLIVMGGALMVRGVVKGNKEFFVINDEMKGNIRLMLLTLTAIIVFLIAWKITSSAFGELGFYVCMCVLELVLNKFMFKRSWLHSILYAIIFTAFIYFVFGKFFAIQFII